MGAPARAADAVKPRPFEYRHPGSVDEALAELAAHGEDAKVLAGGQSLVPMLNFRLTAPDVLIDLNDASDLAGLRRTDGWLRIGAMTRQAAAERSAAVRDGWPILADALQYVAHPPIRNRGTIGGSVAHADPAAELPVVMATLDARFVVRSQAAERTIGADELFVANLATTIDSDELLVRIDVPPLAPGTAWGFREFARRHGDFALGGAAVLLEAEDGACRRLRIGLLAAASRPVVVEVEDAAGRPLPALALDGVEDAVGDAIRPTPDIHGDAAFRRRIVLAMVREAVADAVRRV
jgi:carbon-monoxide dehydrogenase medium subunit/6-hydroxypseudooxynicotine dehydrogenase subunit alpha